MRIQGKTWRTVSFNPYVTEDIAVDLYMLAVCEEDGTVRDYVRAGRPSTYRVYKSLAECINGIRGNKRFYNGDVTFRPVRLLTGEFTEEEASITSE